VGSGTTSKQLSKESHSLSIGYGGMVLEGALAVLVIIAVTAGIGDFEAWNHHYSSWTAASGLAAKLNAFVLGSANMLGSFGIPKIFSLTIMGVFIASFAGTTLDTATRLQRYVVQEFARSLKLKTLTKIYPATAVAVLTAAVLALAQGGGKGGLILWPLFGASNQLLAALGLMVMSVYLARKGKNILVTAIPMVVMIVITTWAMVDNIGSYMAKHQWHLFAINLAIFILALWLVVEGCTFFAKGIGKKESTGE